MEINDALQTINGIGEKTLKLFKKLEIYSIRDLLYYFPRAYKDLSNIKAINQLKIGEIGFLKVSVQSDVVTKYIRQGLEITTFIVSDGTGIINVDIFNQVHIKRYITKGSTLYLYGKIDYSYNKLKITSPEIYFSKPQANFLPIYSLTAGLTQNMLRKFQKQAIENTKITEFYSARFIESCNLSPINEAITNIHFPNTLEDAKKARSRMVFDELLVFNRMLELLDDEQINNNNFDFKTRDATEFLSKLTFTLTDAQKKVMEEIAEDFTKEKLMNRLVQGDVGSGKTVVAFFAMFLAYKNGYQSILMAPTEILANQHYNTALHFFGDDDVVLVTGALNAKAKREAYAKISDGRAKIIIGTHALLFAKASYKNVALIITDEQHRFGVAQRAKLAGDNKDVHTLIMSATPIPRSLALVIYKKTDISIINQMPEGRKEIKTHIIRKNKYEGMLNFIKGELKKGKQAYIVCPLIEENEDSDLKSAKEMFLEIKKNFTGYNLALLHGKLKNTEKQEIMEGFKEGKIQLIVSTTVIEVGINVPNATVMAVQNAERFGLAQLHQLRGRVGRGEAQSYCFLVSDNSNSYERLNVLVNSADGFEIAEKDMMLRGVGDVFGTKQHGENSLKIASLISDISLFEYSAKMLNEMKANPTYKVEYDAITKQAQININETLVEIAFN